MLPSFRLAGSDDDLLSNPDFSHTMPSYIDDLLPSPTKLTSFKLDSCVSNELSGKIDKRFLNKITFN